MAILLYSFLLAWCVILYIETDISGRLWQRDRRFTDKVRRTQVAASCSTVAQSHRRHAPGCRSDGLRRTRPFTEQNHPDSGQHLPHDVTRHAWPVLQRTCHSASCYLFSKYLRLWRMRMSVCLPRTLGTVTCLSQKLLRFYAGRSINKLQKDIILLIFEIIKLSRLKLYSYVLAALKIYVALQRWMLLRCFSIF